MKIPVIVLLLQGIPEGVALTTLAFVISRIPLRLRTILLSGMLIEISVYLVRLFPLPLGLHTILAIFILFLILNIFGKDDVGQSFIMSLLSCIILILLETACFFLLPVVINIIPISLTPYHAVTIVLGDIHVLLLFALAFLIIKIRKQNWLRLFNLRGITGNFLVKDQIKL